MDFSLFGSYGHPASPIHAQVDVSLAGMHQGPVVPADNMSLGWKKLWIPLRTRGVACVLKLPFICVRGC